MAIAIDQATDTSSAGVDMTAVSSLSWATHDVSGANRFLALGLHTMVDGSGGASAVAWDSTGTNQSMTKLRQDLAVSGGRDSCSEIWYLIAPTAGTNLTISITLSTTMHVAAGTLVSFTGVDQATPLDDVGGEGSVDAAGTDWSDTIDTATANAWVFQCVTGKGAATGITQDNGQMEWTDFDTAGAADTMAWSDAYLGPIVTPGTNTLGVSSMNADDIAGSLMAIRPAAEAGGAVYPRKMCLMGVA